MKVRSIDSLRDWNFGKGQNDYIIDNDAVAQCIETRLRSFLGDCFFDVGAGVDWFNLLGSKNQLGLNLAISAVILNSPNVIGVSELSINLDSKRRITIVYSALTIFPGTAKGELGYILDEAGEVIETESGDALNA